MKLTELFDVNGTFAIVTGAASGLGLAYAEVMAENGATVLLIDTNRKQLGEHVERLRRGGCRVDGVSVDTTDTDRLRRAIEAAAERSGRIDTLFANAGVSAGPGPMLSQSGGIEHFDVQRFNQVIAVNMTATLMAMRIVVPHMKRARTGSIVATASVAGMRAEPVCGYAYVASKAAVINLVRQAAVELAPWNIRVNAIAPTSFVTNIANGKMHHDQMTRRLFENIVPLGRLAQPSEIKGLALLLGSSAGSFITGTVIPIDGGATAVVTRGEYSRLRPDGDASLPAE